MTSTRTKTIALRATAETEARLKEHGTTAREAVVRLLDLADEHKTCGAPPSTKRPSKRTTSTKLTTPTSTVQQGDTVYEVQVAGRTTLRTTSKTRAEKAAKLAQERYPNRKVEVR